ncbi:hypothetical protein EBZ80_07055 [bacterium]|nr:hypothetical protein [bacterium]
MEDLLAELEYRKRLCAAQAGYAGTGSYSSQERADALLVQSQQKANCDRIPEIQRMIDAEKTRLEEMRKTDALSTQVPRSKGDFARPQEEPDYSEQEKRAEQFAATYISTRAEEIRRSYGFTSDTDFSEFSGEIEQAVSSLRVSGVGKIEPYSGGGAGIFTDIASFFTEPSPPSAAAPQPAPSPLPSLSVSSLYNQGGAGVGQTLFSVVADLASYFGPPAEIRIARPAVTPLIPIDFSIGKEN